jgi:hypothetical protein
MKDEILEDMSASAAAGTSLLALLGVMVGLAVLDFVGAVLAKEWTLGKGPAWFVGGAVSFLVLFVVYAYGLKIAELSTVTFGWIVGLQVGILLVERLRYGVTLPSGKWAAIVAILALQAYLVLGPGVDESGGDVARLAPADGDPVDG